MSPIPLPSRPWRRAWSSASARCTCSTTTPPPRAAGLRISSRPTRKSRSTPGARSWRSISTACFWCRRRSGVHMIRQRSGGSIIQTASIYGILGADKRIYEGRAISGRRSTPPPSMPPRRPRSSAWPLSRDLLGRARHPRQHADARRRRQRPERHVPVALRRARAARPHGRGGRAGGGADLPRLRRIELCHRADSRRRRWAQRTARPGSAIRAAWRRPNFSSPTGFHPWVYGLLGQARQ